MEDPYHVTGDREVLLSYYNELVANNLVTPCKRAKLSGEDAEYLSPDKLIDGATGKENNNNSLLAVETRNAELCKYSHSLGELCKYSHSLRELDWL